MEISGYGFLKRQDNRRDVPRKSLSGGILDAGGKVFARRPKNGYAIRAGILKIWEFDWRGGANRECAERQNPNRRPCHPGWRFRWSRKAAPDPIASRHQPHCERKVKVWFQRYYCTRQRSSRILSLTATQLLNVLLNVLKRI
jgi:hypothetical protein